MCLTSSRTSTRGIIWLSVLNAILRTAIYGTRFEDSGENCLVESSSPKTATIDPTSLETLGKGRLGCPPMVHNHWSAYFLTSYAGAGEILSSV